MILSKNFGEQFVPLQEELVKRTGLPVYYRPISEHPIPAMHDDIGCYTRQPDCHMIYINLDKAIPIDIAHELMHGLLRLEGYPKTTMPTGDDIAHTLGSHISSFVVHIVLDRRLRLRGFDPSPRVRLAAQETIQRLPTLKGEDAAMQVDDIYTEALRCIEAQFRWGSLGRKYFWTLRETSPEAHRLGKELIEIIKAKGWRSPRQCRASIVAIIKRIDRAYVKHGHNLFLSKRIGAAPLWFPSRQLLMKAKEIFDPVVCPTGEGTSSLLFFILKEDDSFVASHTQTHPDTEKVLSLAARDLSTQTAREFLDTAYIEWRQV